jgi:hypothetical protein
MHESLARLLEHARQKTAGSSRPVYDEIDLRTRMEVSPAVFSNWKARGISKEGALSAEAKFGCSAHWLLSGKQETTAKSWWLFRVLTPDQVSQLSPKALQSVENLAISLLEIQGAPPSEVEHKYMQTDTVVTPRSEGFSGKQEKPSFMKKEQSGQRSADPRPSRKARDG